MQQEKIKIKLIIDTLVTVAFEKRLKYFLIDEEFYSFKEFFSCKDV